jgi:YfiH family protein
MPIHQPELLKYFTFESLDDSGLNHAIFTRHGGISPEPWASLNVGGTVGDDPDRVRTNRIRSLKALNCDPSNVYDVWQVHGSEVVYTDSPRDSNKPYIKADAIITDRDKVTLFMRFADCVPILLYDSIRKVISLVHAGWKGTVDGVVTATVEAMVKNFQCNSKDILAGIGPSIGPHHYEIGEDVASLVGNAFGPESTGLLISTNGKIYFDLWSANALLLARSGVKEIEQSGICTACHLDDWYSHRAERGKTGRFGALITL